MDYNFLSLFKERTHPNQKHDLHDGSMLEFITQKHYLLYKICLFGSGTDHSVTKDCLNDAHQLV